MATPLINGQAYTWGGIQMLLFGYPVIGITKITYKSKRDKKNNYGAGSKPVSRGYGNEEYEASIEISMDEWRRIINAAPNKKPTDIPPFDITVLFGGNGVLPTKDVLKSVEFLEDGLDAAQGATQLLITIPLIIGDIEHK